MCFLHLLPFHNVIFFHNYCTIDSTTMSTAYPQHIHIVLFTTTLQCILALLFIHAVLFTMWYFFTITAQFTLQQCLQHILNIYIQYYYNYTTQYTNFAVYICCPFHNVIFFHNHCPIYLYNNVYSIYSTYTYSTGYNYTTQYTGFGVYIYFPFHNMIFFHNYCPIDSTTMFTAYTKLIHTVLFTITPPSTLKLLYTYAVLFTMWYFFTITAQFTLQQCYSIYSTYTYSTVYNYTTQYTGFAVCICFPFHNVIFFLNYCIIYSTTVFTAYT